MRRHAEVFRRYFDSDSDEEFAEHVADASAEPETAASWAADEPDANRIDKFTRDFVLKTLLHDLEHEEFEHFTADLLRAMGYQARVTPYVADGGIDAIAHRDPLGLEPPTIKVQCKHTDHTQSRPDVQRLIGTLSAGELGLFVTLGAYSRDAVDLERERQNLRLFSDKDVTDLTLQYYEQLTPHWRSRLPMRHVYVLDRGLTAG